ncbi:MAG: hypothetical protein AAFV45_07730 [Pseudomonadota bacterium]
MNTTLAILGTGILGAIFCPIIVFFGMWIFASAQNDVQLASTLSMMTVFVFLPISALVGFAVGLGLGAWWCKP